MIVNVLMSFDGYSKARKQKGDKLNICWTCAKRKLSTNLLAGVNEINAEIVIMAWKILPCPFWTPHHITLSCLHTQVWAVVENRI